MMHRATLGLAIAAAVCAGTPALATAAPMDSGYANCDGNTNCSTGILAIGAGTVYADFDLQGLRGTSVTLKVLRNGKELRSCTHTVLVGGSGTLPPCDFYAAGDIEVTGYAQITATTFRIGWHQ
jgi:hypothetical protein